MTSLYTPTLVDIPKANRLVSVTWEAGSLWAPWRDLAACVNYSREAETPGDFTAEYQVDPLERGRALCRVCPVALQCLSDALEESRLGGKPHGLRGGFYFVMGGLDEDSQKLLRKQYRAKSKPTPNSH